MEFKQLKKLIANIKARQTKVTADNKAFKKLTKQQQRVAIAKDALQQLNTRKYIASPGSWCDTKLPTRVHDELRELEGWAPELSDSAAEIKAELRNVHRDNENVLQPLLQEPGVSCEVCALGSLFASAVRKADSCSTDALAFAAAYGDRHHEADSDDVTGALDGYFSNAQQRLMEIAFEEGGGAHKPHTTQEFKASEMYAGKNPSQRLRAILNNVITNDGVFKVTSK